MAHKHTTSIKVGRNKANAAKAQMEDSRQRVERRLRERQRELEQELANTVAQAKAGNDNDTPDVADLAVAGYQKEMLFSQGTVRNAQLRMVRQALSRLAAGSYGDCLRCDEPIGPKRIEALPWTPYCIGCQEQIERGDMETSAVA